MADQQSEQPVVFIRRLLTRLIRELENCNGRSDHIDTILYHIDWLYNSLVHYFGAYNSISDELVSIVCDANDLLQSLVHEYEAPNSYRTEQVSYGGRGRPKFDLSRDQLEFFLERGFSVPDVAHMLGLSVRTTERRLQEFNISARQFFTIIDDETLDHTIEDILRSSHHMVIVE